VAPASTFLVLDAATATCLTRKMQGFQGIKATQTPPHPSPALPAL
jgi:hypothetical protein